MEKTDKEKIDGTTCVVAEVWKASTREESQKRNVSRVVRNLGFSQAKNGGRKDLEVACGEVVKSEAG